MQNQPIKATRGNEVHVFPSVRQCATYLEVTSYVLARAMSFGLPVDGWTIEKTEPEEGQQVVLHTDAVIGTTPKGVHVRFESITQAAKRLRCNANAIRSIVKRRDKDATYGTWKWAMDDGTFETVEPEDLVCCSFCLRGESGRKTIVKEDIATETDVDPYANREVEMTGVYDEDFGVVICPVCQMVVNHNRSEADYSGYKHLSRCLAGRDWEVKFGIIKVYK